jgi:hypothetical protein
VPAEFVPLVHVLQAFQQAGNNCPLRSTVSDRLCKEHPGTLSSALKAFRNYTNSVKAEGIIHMGGEQAEAWMQLKI